ncbi:MAG: glycoside hydrolase family 127 protein [Planctomycetes bacterium]|nr:glycoside hydrolase family 127 protein [Planctomycetota bacterium]
MTNATRIRMGVAGAAILAAAVTLGAGPKDEVAPVVPLKALAFDLRDVRLLDGPFEHAMELDRDYLLRLDVDRLLHTFRLNAGLPSTAKPYGGWEAPDCEVRGHFTGHYMTACALMYASTGDARLKERGDRVVAGLAECQAKIGTGYLSAYPESFIDRVEARQRVWAPYYTLHKIYAGLQDMYVHCGNAQALEAARKFADWAKARNDRLSDGAMQAMLGNEHGGMNETLANLYALTAEKDYLGLSLRFNHQAVIGPASRREDRLTGLHANTQVPKFIGTARQYELTGDDSLRTASAFFWDVVVNERSYVIGGHSDGEAFSPKERLSEAFGPNTTETCNTYNMLKLTRLLYCQTARPEYADYYERALYNHILSSQNPETGMMCYYVPLRSGSRKTFNTPEDSFWCCTGTGIENHAKYGDSIYFHDGDETLYVNLFIASELAWRAKGVKVRQETRYPDEESTRILLTCERPIELAIAIRHPYWATAGFHVTVNGEKAAVEIAPGSYATLRRTWASGDAIEVRMPMTLRTEGFRDNPRRLAFLYGPIVLCAAVREGEPIPIILREDGDARACLKPVPGETPTFRGSPACFRIPGREEGVSPTFTPFYKMYRDPYVVYWDVYTAGQWKAKEDEARAERERLAALDARTVDVYRPGDREDEKAKELTGENTGAGEFGGRGWRHATEGGWFSFRMKVAGGPLELACTYWGSDGGERIFDILVDGTKIATQRLQMNRPGVFYDEVYRIPEELTKGKETVTVRLQAQPGKWAGGIFGARMLRR